MRKALYILGQLNDGDVEWLARHGTKQVLADGEIIIREGSPIDTLFIALNGQLQVTLTDGREVARLGIGEVVGEMSLVDNFPPAATVTAAGPALVLALRRTVLQKRLAAEPQFAARFYRALAIFLADRLRATTRRFGYGETGDLDNEAALEDELDEAVLDTVSQAGERFVRLLQSISAGGAS
jgi:CRP/FNR family cyclic AMP-dependent transcriptional regulator